MSTNPEIESENAPGAASAPGPTFLVLEHDALISSDLIQTLRGLGPCRVLHVTSVDDGMRALNGLHRVDAAFLEMQYDEAVQSGLARSLGQLGARMVLTRGEDTDLVAGRGWRLLARPFTERMIHESLSES